MKVGTLQKKSLFWDVKNVDFVKNERFVIERVLVYGDENDFHWLMDIYGSERVKDVIKKSRVLNKKSSKFWCDYFEINKMQCNNQLTKRQSPFWRR